MWKNSISGTVILKVYSNNTMKKFGKPEVILFLECQEIYSIIQGAFFSKQYCNILYELLFN